MAKSKKVRRGRAVYERLLTERDRDGLTWQALSERSGVPLSTLQEWARRVHEESVPSFVEVAPDVFEIDLVGGRRVRVPMRFDPEALRSLVSVLDTSC